VAAVLAPDLVTVTFGSRWEALVPPFQVLVVGMMFRTSYRMSDSVSKATGMVYSRAWRQALYAGLVFLGAWIGRAEGLTGVALGVLGALFINYLVMAQLSLRVGQISWLRFAKVQMPALRLAIILGAVTLATTTATRQLGLPPIAGLLLGSAAAASSAALVAWLAPTFAVGEQGMRMYDMLRAQLLARVRPQRLRGSA
jgi:O-antigen/teichoic acid export membrane protein